MTARLLVDSLLMWSAQVLLLVATAALACRWLPHARARLFVWQGVLGLSLLLPLIMPQRLPEPIEVTQTADDGLVNVGTHVLVNVPARAPVWRSTAILWLVGSVALARLFWLGFGVLRLRRLRNHAERLPHPLIPTRLLCKLVRLRPCAGSGDIRVEASLDSPASPRSANAERIVGSRGPA